MYKQYAIMISGIQSSDSENIYNYILQYYNNVNMHVHVIVFLGPLNACMYMHVNMHVHVITFLDPLKACTCMHTYWAYTLNNQSSSPSTLAYHLLVYILKNVPSSRINTLTVYKTN